VLEDTVLEDTGLTLGTRLALSVLDQDPKPALAQRRRAGLLEPTGETWTFPLREELLELWPQAGQDLWSGLWPQCASDEWGILAEMLRLPERLMPLDRLMARFGSMMSGQRLVSHPAAEIPPAMLPVMEMLQLSGEAHRSVLGQPLLTFLLGWHGRGAWTLQTESTGRTIDPRLIGWLRAVDPDAVEKVAVTQGEDPLGNWSIKTIAERLGTILPAPGQALGTLETQGLLRSCAWVDTSAPLHGGRAAMLPEPRELARHWTQGSWRDLNPQTVLTVFQDLVDLRDQLGSAQGRAVLEAALQQVYTADQGVLELRLPGTGRERAGHSGPVLRLVWGPAQAGAGAGEAIVAWAGAMPSPRKKVPRKETQQRIWKIR